MNEITAAEQIMEKKSLMRAELDKQTRNGDELWKKATEKLETFLNGHSSLSKGDRMHTDSRIFPAGFPHLRYERAASSRRRIRSLPAASEVPQQNYPRRPTWQ